MPRTPSNMVPIGSLAPDFSLPDPDENFYSRDQVSGSKGLLVIFMCNHCPFVKHVGFELGKFGNEFPEKGIGVVGINSNDVVNYPDDAPPEMKKFARHYGITFPYLFDETQQVAREYGAACTPDFFLYDQNLKLVYRGQLDDSRPGNDIPVTGRDLRGAMNALINGEQISEDQVPAIGCNIKWKEGNEPG